MVISLPRRWHALAILIVCAFVSLVYTPATAANYCGFDDFLELHRAEFEDMQHPERIWTSTHRGSTKYRPVYRLANDVTYWWSHGAPLAFHLRNLFFHCLAAVAVYGLGLPALLLARRLRRGPAVRPSSPHPSSRRRRRVL